VTGGCRGVGRALAERLLGPDPRRATRAVGVPRRQRKLVDIPVGRMVAVRADPAQEQEWLRQLSLVYSGLIGIGVLMVQPFLIASSLDLPAKVCVVAFSVAIPLLASLVVLNRQEAFRRRATRSVVAQLTRVVAQTLRLRWRGRRLLAHPVDRRGGGVGERARGGGGSLGKLLAPGTGAGAHAPGRRRTRRRRAIDPCVAALRKWERAPVSLRPGDSLG
jgi:hypothetical protein